MEIEQEKSLFMPFPEIELVSNKKGGLASSAFLYKLPDSFLKVKESIRFLSPQIYEFVDSVTGYDSYRFEGSEEKVHNFAAIIEFLKKEGLVKKLGINAWRRNDAPAFFGCALNAGYPPNITDGRIPEKVYGGSIGKDISTVLSKAIGEFLERYFLTIYRKKNLRLASWRALKSGGLASVNLADLDNFSEEQKNSNREFLWDEKSVFNWERMERISTGRTIYVPAQLVYWGYNRGSSEPVLGELNTNAQAGYFSKEGSILASIYELIQRDSFFTYWLNSISPPKINPESVPYGPFRKLLEESSRYGFKVHCLNTTLDSSIPSFVTVIEDPSGSFPPFSLAAGCELNPEKAIFRSLEEAWAVYYGFLLNSSPLPPAFLENYRPFTEKNPLQPERFHIWASPEARKHYEFLLQGEERNFKETFPNYESFSSDKDELDFIVRSIENLGQGYEVYAYTQQHPILSRLGYYVSKVVVPRMVPLYLREYLAPLGSARLKEIPKKMEWKKTKLNIWPHPFP